MITLLYRQAIKCQIPINDFWQYSPAEVYDLIQDHYEKQERGLKQRVTDSFFLAEIIAGYMLREEKQDIPHPWEYYPELFSEEQKIYEEKKKEAELEEYKEKRKAYIAEMNKRRHR